MDLGRAGSSEQRAGMLRDVMRKLSKLPRLEVIAPSGDGGRRMKEMSFSDPECAALTAALESAGRNLQELKLDLRAATESARACSYSPR